MKGERRQPGSGDLPWPPPTPQLRSLPQFLTIFSSNVRQIMCLPQSLHLLTRGHAFALLFYNFVSLHKNISVVKIIHVSYTVLYIVYLHTCNSLWQWCDNKVRISLADTPTTLMAIFITDDVYDKLTFWGAFQKYKHCNFKIWMWLQCICDNIIGRNNYIASCSKIKTAK